MPLPFNNTPIAAKWPLLIKLPPLPKWPMGGIQAPFNGMDLSTQDGAFDNTPIAAKLPL